MAFAIGHDKDELHSVAGLWRACRGARDWKIERLREIIHVIGMKNACTLLKHGSSPPGPRFGHKMYWLFGSPACQLVALIRQVRHSLTHPRQLRKAPRSMCRPRELLALFEIAITFEITARTSHGKEAVTWHQGC